VCLFPPIVPFAFATAPHSERIIHVNAQTTGAEAGTSWFDAYRDLQSALAVAAASRISGLLAGEVEEQSPRETR
jgi:hypothetical protein